MKKTIRIICIILSALFIQYLYSQTSPFSKVIYDELSISIQAYDIAATPDKGYILVGESIGENALVIKIDSLGNPIWNKIYFTSNSMEFLGITNTYDSCYVIGGRIFNSENHNWDIFLTKITTNGDYFWIKNFTMDIDYASYLTSISETNDSGFIICGYTYEFDQYPINQILVIKTNSEGELQWSKKYYAGNNVNKAYSIKELDNGEYIVSGEFNTISNNSFKALAINLSNEGDVNWAKKYLFEEQENIATKIYDVEISSNQQTYLMSINGSTVLMRTDLYGTTEWGKDYNLNSDYFGKTPRIHKTSNEHFIFVSGYSFGNYVKTDLEGNVLQYAGLMLNPEDIIEVENKGLLILGNGPLIAVKNDQAYYDNIGIILIDSLGNGVDCIESGGINFSDISINDLPIDIITENSGFERYQVFNLSWQFPAVRNGCVDVIGSLEELNQTQIEIYPNPAKSTIQIVSENMQNGILQIFAIDGKQIKTYQNLTIPSQIDISYLKNGIYFYKYETNENQKYIGKISVLK